ncbi:hypothetical protein RMSM_04569 [Rhodopirellula maiorica SM1]|uniref:Uncharacterized protein n=1 Tax=Rhodopirellula maiorica SM1 TaxID=1265738 RepID=M5RT07_9BACT|nr:hypothetical protein RMSM_04569 [Rhodopirellula maiorica SM1]
MPGISRLLWRGVSGEWASCRQDSSWDRSAKLLRSSNLVTRDDHFVLGELATRPRSSLQPKIESTGTLTSSRRSFILKIATPACLSRLNPF